MKILVLGDTHGKLDKVRDIFPKLKDIDLIAHTGDYIRDAKSIEKEFHKPVVCVSGNCDRINSPKEIEIIRTEYGRILLTHGHLYNVKYDMTSLMYKAMEENCKAVFFGHTHRCMIDETNGIRFINPGSLTIPRDGSGGSYAIVRTYPDSIESSIVYYDTVMKNETIAKKSGRIRRLLNYSDRF